MRLAVLGLCLASGSCARAAGGPVLGHAAPSGFSEVGGTMGLCESLFSGGHEKRFIRQTLGQGLAWIDVEGDGDLDLFAPSGPADFAGLGDARPSEPWRLWILEDGRFVEGAAAAGLDGRGWGLGCAVGDVDSDGRPDLFVTVADGPDRLFRARGDGTFEDRTESSGLGSPQLSTGAAFGDLDRDGDLDLVVAAYLDESRPPPGPCHWKGKEVMCGPKGFPPLEPTLWRNDGSGRFERTDALAGYLGYGLGVLLFDANGDGALDVYVANDSSPNHFFVNHGHGRFEERGLFAGVALGSSGTSQAGMGVDAGDLDGDGRMDLVVTNFSDDVHNLYHNEADGFFRDIADRTGLARASFSRLGWSVILEDFDLDGDVDVFLANGHVYPEVDAFDSGTSYRQAPQLLFNDGRGGLTEAPERLGSAFSEPINARGAAAADVDSDGDLDLALVRDGAPPLLFLNHLPAPGTHWLVVRLVGGPPNTEAIGARVELLTTGRTQVREVRRNRGYLSSSSPLVHFGLGRATEARELLVTWPDGATERRPVEGVDRVVVLSRSVPPAGRRRNEG